MDKSQLSLPAQKYLEATLKAFPTVAEVDFILGAVEAFVAINHIYEKLTGKPFAPAVFINEDTGLPLRGEELASFCIKFYLAILTGDKGWLEDIEPSDLQ